MIAENLGRAAFAYPHVHGTLVELRLGCGKAGHGREESDTDETSLIRDHYQFRMFAFVQPQGTAIE